MFTGLEGAEEVLFSGWILNQLIVWSSSSVGGRMDTGLEGGAEEVLFSGWILNQLIVWSSSSVGGRVIYRDVHGANLVKHVRRLLLELKPWSVPSCVIVERRVRAVV